MSKFKSIVVVLISLAFFVTACDKKEEATAEAEEATAEKAEEPAAEEKADEKAEAEEEELAMVEVPKEGKAFDPPVEKEQIPAGAWICDMGTVHYARMEKGDGVCPECNMKLKHTGAEGGEKAAEGHEGHNH